MCVHWLQHRLFFSSDEIVFLICVCSGDLVFQYVGSSEVIGSNIDYFSQVMTLFFLYVENFAFIG